MVFGQTRLVLEEQNRRIADAEQRRVGSRDATPRTSSRPDVNLAAMSAQVGPSGWRWRLGRAVVLSGLTVVLSALTVVALWASADEAGAATSEVSATIKKRVLTVIGTTAADAITLRLQAADPNTLEVDFGADGTADFAFDRQLLTAIVIDARAGDDTIVADQFNGAFTDTEFTTFKGGDGTDTLIGGYGAETLLGGPGADFLFGNQLADTIDGGDGDDVIGWDPGNGNDTVSGGAGVDRLAFNGSSANETIDLSAAAGHVRLTRNIGTVTLDLDDVETADLRALGGTDTITVTDLTGTDLTTLTTDLAAFDGTDDTLNDEVIVNGTAGDDVIAVIDEGADVVAEGLPATIRIAHADPTLDRLTVNGLEGNDEVTATPGAGALILLNLQP